MSSTDQMTAPDPAATAPAGPSKRIVFSFQLLTNIGCEIIIRGSIAFLKRAYPDHDLTFVVSSYHPERDRALLADVSGVRVVPMLERKRYVRGVLRKTGLFISHWTPRFASSEFKSADLFCSVGGDIYTMFGDALPEDWLGYESYATRHGIPAIMFGANMERFEVLSEAHRAQLLDHLKRFRLLVARDKGTADYLAGHGIADNVAIFPDPIFSLRPKTVFERRKVHRIGINFTPFLLEKFGDGIVERYARITEGLVRQGYEVSLVPHVSSPDGRGTQHDPRTLDQLHAALAPDIAAKVQVWRGEMSFASISQMLFELDMFVGARMHGCLSSLTLGKPVFFVGYSRKAKTMVDWLKSASPFADMAQSFCVKDGDKVELSDIEALIADHDAWSAAGDTPVTVDTRGWLDGLPLWQKMPDLSKA
ncbi:polysaccharide pyruvyl transferase family protein [Salipiger sp. 1_MG-2023]|uniref:polysaccharide pyruvyl transferase family protein n=1 Tax=Salipiger sp. 1_MG-2023 TaxID=3062665 RepID=UPI0026E235A5|nr:polysaccharide pyruvyl transferase family protein [Salipiger sp. 1_MG-2023]MDO6586985.1 polysaccharide pyruvyl transferase family protein [Salipiger sp. 1_MG-2023]